MGVRSHVLIYTYIISNDSTVDVMWYTLRQNLKEHIDMLYILLCLGIPWNKHMGCGYRASSASAANVLKVSEAKYSFSFHILVLNDAFVV